MSETRIELLLEGGGLFELVLTEPIEQDSLVNELIEGAKRGGYFLRACPLNWPGEEWWVSPDHIIRWKRWPKE
jgi:hypothetical protein